MNANTRTGRFIVSQDGMKQLSWQEYKPLLKNKPMTKENDDIPKDGPPYSTTARCNQDGRNMMRA